MPPTVRSIEFYYDSGATAPKEDPERIEERLATVAEREGIEYESIDTADYSEEERTELYSDATARIRDDREYHVGNRVFTRGMFASTRPVLLIHYEDRDGIDLYPHRAGGRSGVVGILDFFDEIAGDDEEGEETDAAAPEASNGSTADDEESESPATASDAGLLSRLTALLPG